MRPITNLKANLDFKLDKSAMQSGFVALWNGKVGESPLDMMARLCLNLVYPFTTGLDIDFSGKELRDFLDQHKIHDANQDYAIKSTLVKNVQQKRMEFRTPICVFKAFDEANYLAAGWWTDLSEDLKKMTADRRKAVLETVKTLADTPFAGGKILSGAEVASITKIPTKAKNLLANSLKSIEAIRANGETVLWATWIITAREAEYLNNTPFLEIKLSNFYPSLKDWSAACLGKLTNMPSTIAPISKVAAGVKDTFKDVTPVPRVGIDNMVVDINQHYYIIPELDNSQDYEQQLLDFGMRDDGSYSFYQDVGQGPDEVNIGDQMPGKKLPANMPIFTDWLNDKFSYSNSAGNLTVYDLSNTAPVAPFHILSVLNSAIDPDLKTGISKVISMAVNAAAAYDPTILRERPTIQDILDAEKTPAEFNGAYDAAFKSNPTSFRDLVAAARSFHEALVGDFVDFYVVGKEPVPYMHQLNANVGLGTQRFIGRSLAKALEVINENQEVMFRKYAVMTILQMQALLNIIVNHSKNRDVLHAQDQKDRDAYLNQNEDPEYQVEALPLIRKDFKYLPHQFRVQNKMRRGPKFAIWGVDAGGGKTPIALTNTLNELQHKRCSRPLIMCPSHLIAQYVKEVVYVTEGRLNIIPLTNATMKLHGEEALAKMIVNAPPNTACLADFNFIKNRSQEVAYGNKSLTVYRNAEFMRQFEFDMVVVDECHYLKNYGSARRDAAARLIQDIPMKRLTSGTIVSDTIKDLVSQVALLDPTIFGSEDHFKAEFAAEMKGSKVLAYKPGAEIEVRRRINDHCVYATAKRKEWAALLPPKEEKFHGVELSDNQRLLYQSILEETMALIEEAMAKNPELKEAMESEDESKAESMEHLLRPYMARLERFLSAPMADPAAQLFLKNEEDMLSPKVRKIYEICRKHLADNLPGKVLIFTQYTASAEAVYDQAPPDLKPYFLHYTADNKIEARSAYENEPDKKIMVGVSSSMDTGLNFQHVSRLIRMETVWTPGVLEQGNSRINRPQVKSQETRPTIYFDWLVVNRTVDITKVSRLIAKIISKAKYDEFDNPAYQALTELPQVPVTIESIAANNDFKESLMEYLMAYNDYAGVQKEDYRQYREQNGDKLDAVPVPQNGVLEGSKLMRKVPYVPEMEIYGADKLGLMRYDQFLRQDFGDTEDEGGGDDEGEEEQGDDTTPMDPRSAARKAAIEARRREREILKNRPCHTDFGDGVITGVGKKMCTVQFSDGSRKKVFKMQVYLITRAYTNGIDLRNELLKQVGEIPADTPENVPVQEGPADVKRKKRGGDLTVGPVTAPQELSAEFDLTIVNDFLGIRYRGDGTNGAVLNVLQTFGFRVSPDYHFAYVRDHVILLRMVKLWQAEGFKIDKATSATLHHIFDALKSNKASLQTFGFSVKHDLQNFYRDQIKPSADRELLKVYPLVEDGRLYIVLPIKGQAANNLAAKVRVPGTSWKVGGGDSDIIRFVNSKAEVVTVLKEIKAAGIQLTNSKELEQQFNKVKLAKR